MEEKKEEKNEIFVEAEKRRLLQLSEISLWLDTYDDIFSDFDPREYSQRALSDDFLYEAKKASMGKPSGKIELKFLIPKEQRNNTNESVIIKRLHEHFKKHYLLLKKEVDEFIKQGMLFVFVGIIITLITTFILIKDTQKTLFISFLIVLLEPAGWFFLWEGLRQVIFESKNKKPDIEFYKRMASCEIKFLS